jgi:hypothetical protein
MILMSWRFITKKNISNTRLGLYLHDCTVQQHYVPPVIMAICDAQNCTILHLGRMHQAAIPDEYPIPDEYGHGYKILAVSIVMGGYG